MTWLRNGVPQDTRPEQSHYWDWCGVCQGRVVICGKCGNNCCNGSYGTLPGGLRCDACPSAYAMQDRGEQP